LPSQIEAVHREFKDRGLVVWAISTREAPHHIMAWLKEHPISPQVLLDLDGTVTEAFRATGTPSFVLVDRAGQLVGRGVGPRDWSGDRGRALIRALLSGP
jgi:peroxiredoxin